MSVQKKSILPEDITSTPPVQKCVLPSKTATPIPNKDVPSVPVDANPIPVPSNSQTIHPLDTLRIFP